MSNKNRDKKNRWRSVTIAFRVSPEENADLNMRVKLSGLSKQDYITRRCQERAVIVVGSPRVYKALKNQMTEILVELQRLEKGASVSDDLLEIIRVVAMTVDGMKDEHDEVRKNT